MTSCGRYVRCSVADEECSVSVRGGWKKAWGLNKGRSTCGRDGETVMNVISSISLLSFSLLCFSGLDIRERCPVLSTELYYLHTTFTLPSHSTHYTILSTLHNTTLCTIPAPSPFPPPLRSLLFPLFILVLHSLILPLLLSMFLANEALCFTCSCWTCYFRLFAFSFLFLLVALLNLSRLEVFNEVTECQRIRSN